jgi:2-haloacid dehalogenase
MKTVKAIVFDLYGTLYDVHSVARLGNRFYPDRGRELSILWRQKQLEYTWLRSLMGAYVSFEKATEDSLVYACKQLKLPLDQKICIALCDEYLKILPYPEVPAALAALKAMGLPLAILSNGSVNSVRSVVEHSGLQHCFAHLLSVESVKVFKPHPSVYRLAEARLGHGRSDILFVSSNSWDASGASHFGYVTCWINRGGNTFDELGQSPDHIVGGLDELVAWMKA